MTSACTRSIRRASVPVLDCPYDRGMNAAAADGPVTFTARGEELDWVGRRWHAGASSLVRGRAGVGKSALLRHFAALAERSGARVVMLSGGELSASIPLGAFLPLVETTALPARHAPDLIWLAATLRERAAMASLLVVDDAHLLDPASAGIVHQLVTDGRPAVLAVRSGERVPAAVDALWTEDRVRVTELQPFTERETAQYVAAVLGGPVDGGAVRALYMVSGGNALYVRELVRAATTTCALRERRGVWVLQGELPVASDLVAALDLQLRDLPDDVRATVELVALAGAIRLDQAERIVGVDVIERAERVGVVRIDGDHDTVEVGHPLYRGVALLGISEARRRRLLSSLLSSLPSGELGDAERVSRGRWSLEAGSALAVDEWVALARVVQVTDPLLAERCLRAAVAAGGGISAMLALANLLVHQHRVTEAERIFDELERMALDPQARLQLLVIRGFLLAMPGQRPEEALALARQGMASAGPLPHLLAIEALASWRIGRVDEAIAIAVKVSRDQDAPAGARANAALTAASAMIYGLRFRASEYGAAVRLVHHLVPLATDELPEGPESAQLVVASQHAMRLSGVDIAQGVTYEGYLRALHAGDDGVRAQFALLHGWTLALGGRVKAAAVALREAHAGRGVWTPTTLPWVRAVLVTVLCLRGAVDEARGVLGLLDAAPRAGLYDLDVALARAALLVAQGRTAAAIELLTAATPEATRRGQRLRVCDAWYARLRYGDDAAADGVVRAFAADDTPETAAIIAHARAVAARDPDAVEHAARGLEERNLRWYACEAQARAVRMYDENGDQRRAQFATERLARLVDECDGLDSPVVRPLLRPTLTPRERQVAALAGRSSDREIADELGISVRTVQTHLVRVYAKLRVRSRTELRVVLDAHGEPRGSSR